MAAYIAATTSRYGNRSKSFAVRIISARNIADTTTTDIAAEQIIVFIVLNFISFSLNRVEQFFVNFDFSHWFDSETTPYHIAVDIQIIMICCTYSPNIVRTKEKENKLLVRYKNKLAIAYVFA
jgi:hypothetical protein